MTINLTIPPVLIEVVCHVLAALFYMTAGVAVERDEEFSALVILIIAVILTVIAAHQ